MIAPAYQPPPRRPKGPLAGAVAIGALLGGLCAFVVCVITKLLDHT